MQIDLGSLVQGQFSGCVLEIEKLVQKPKAKKKHVHQVPKTIKRTDPDPLSFHRKTDN